MSFCIISEVILAAHFDAVRTQFLAIFAVGIAEVRRQAQREDVVGQTGVADFNRV